MEWLPEIEQLIEISCRKRALRPEESEDFASWAKIRFIEDDYRRVRMFEGRSQLRTYLTVVVQNLLRDYLDHIWGRWRPSATAKRLGPDAIKLERKISRDGLSPKEAVQSLASEATDAEEKALDLEKILFQLPVREGRHMVGLGDVVEVASQSTSDSTVVEHELEACLERIRAALGVGLAELEVSDRLLVQQRFAHGLTVTEIAAGMGIDRRKLYRRFESCMRRLRRTMKEQGIEPSDIRSVVGWKGCPNDLDLAAFSEDANTQTLKTIGDRG